MEAKSSAGRSRTAPRARAPGVGHPPHLPVPSSRPAIVMPRQVSDTGAHRASGQHSMARPVPSAGQEGTLHKSRAPGHMRRRCRLPAVSPMFRLMSWPVHKNGRLSSPGCRACARLSRLPAAVHSRPPKVSGSRRQQCGSRFERPPGCFHRTRTPHHPPRRKSQSRLATMLLGANWDAVPRGCARTVSGIGG